MDGRYLGVGYHLRTRARGPFVLPAIEPRSHPKESSLLFNYPHCNQEYFAIETLGSPKGSG
jgi:hypothetical protein